MKALARNCSVMTATALLVACAAQRDVDKEVAGPPAPPPPQVAGRVDVPRTLPEVAARTEAESVEKQQRARNELAVEDVIVTSSRQQSMVMHSPMAIAVAPFAAPAASWQQPANTEQYEHNDENPVHRAAEQPVSTFSIDVDTGAYANVRRFLNDGQLPPQDAVRVEEMINYFDYRYAPPTTRETPFRVATELAQAPWNEQAWLLRIGIKGFEIDASERPAANLVFLIDVSGSMESPDKLPLLKNAFRLLTDQLTARDRVSMVVYAGNSGVVLEPTAGDQKHKIREAIDRLGAGGSTNGAEGIERAYQLAKAAHIPRGINRVVLATDGDFNVGVVNFEALVDMAERHREAGTALTTLGFGSGNYNDKLLERLADAGNGNYAYIDSLGEARKVLVSELSSTLFTIAKDVKIQVEFNPAQVAEYRLIGYENRMLAREDFNNDKVDAGEIGAGHRITALYEVIPVGAKGRIDDLRYAAPSMASASRSGEIANVRLRYKLPDGEASKLLEYPIARRSLIAADKASPDLRFAASVAAFGQLLRGGKYLGSFGYPQTVALAKSALDDDVEGYRREFVSLVTLAQSLTPQEAGETVGQINR
jgi:Ca-activated chloride channel homolog